MITITKFFTIKEFAAAVGLGRKRISKAIKRRQIHATMVGDRYLIPSVELARLSNPMAFPVVIRPKNKKSRPSRRLRKSIPSKSLLPVPPPKQPQHAQGA